MAIRFVCSCCKKTLSAPDHKGGVEVTCPGCKTRLKIPPPALASTAHDQGRAAVPGWHYQKDGKQLGPVSEADLKQLAVTGKLQPTDMVRKQGMAQWVAIGSVSGVYPPTPPVVSAAPPLPPLPASSAMRNARPEEPSQDAKPGLIAKLKKRLRESAFVQKAKAKWQSAGSPTKVGIIAGAGVGSVILLLFCCGMPVTWFFGGSGHTSKSASDSSKTASGTGASSNLASEPGDSPKTASEIMKELRACREAAHAEFGGKSFTVSGIVEQVSSVSLTLKGDNSESPFLVYCTFANTDTKKGRAKATEQLKGVKRNQSVTIKCVFDKMSGGKTFLKNCELVEGPGTSVLELVKNCDDFKAPFNQTYAGKRLRLSGIIVRAGKSFEDWKTLEDWTIPFQTDTEYALLVRCRFKAKYDKHLECLSPGDNVVIEGTCKGSVFASFGEIVLLDGEVVSLNGSSLPTSVDGLKPDEFVKRLGSLTGSYGGPNTLDGNTAASLMRRPQDQSPKWKKHGPFKQYFIGSSGEFRAKDVFRAVGKPDRVLPAPPPPTGRDWQEWVWLRNDVVFRCWVMNITALQENREKYEVKANDLVIFANPGLLIGGGLDF